MSALPGDGTDDPVLRKTAEALGLPWPFPASPVYRGIAARVAREAGRGDGPVLLGVCGSQGSGKSTLAAFLAALLNEGGIATASLSLDDLYLDPEQRPIDVHPLFATRGVPGTHDIALGHSVIDTLTHAARTATTPVPHFDKARDRRAPRPDWPLFSGRADVVILEGWCVGTPPQTEAALATPISALEATEDADGRWRRYANACLGGEYRTLFDRLSLLVFLKAPSFDCVFGWRSLQERKLRDRVGADAPGLMDAPHLARFIQHYERLTRHALATLPDRADIVCHLNADQTIAAVDGLEDGFVAPAVRRH